MDVLEGIHGRRAVRDCRDEPRSREALDALMDAAVRAPSGINTQPWRCFIVGKPAGPTQTSERRAPIVNYTRPAR